MEIKSIIEISISFGIVVLKSWQGISIHIIAKYIEVIVEKEITAKEISILIAKL